METDFIMRMLQMLVKELIKPRSRLVNVFSKTIFLIDYLMLNTCLKSIDQLAEIKKNSLSTLLCNNLNIATIQPDVFFTEAAAIR